MVLIPLGYSSSLRRLVSAVSAGLGCVDEVGGGNDDVRTAGFAAGGTVASGLDDGFASGLSLSLFSERRQDFLTE